MKKDRNKILCNKQKNLLSILLTTFPTGYYLSKNVKMFKTIHLVQNISVRKNFMTIVCKKCTKM